MIEPTPDDIRTVESDIISGLLGELIATRGAGIATTRALEEVTSREVVAALALEAVQTKLAQAWIILQDGDKPAVMLRELREVLAPEDSMED